MALFLGKLNFGSGFFPPGKTLRLVAVVAIMLSAIGAVMADEATDASLLTVSDSDATTTMPGRITSPSKGNVTLLPSPVPQASDAAEDYFGVDWASESPDDPFDLKSVPALAKLKTFPFPANGWTIDYRLRSYCSSQTSYEVGTVEEPPAGWAPLSMLRFGLDSPWHGLNIGYNQPKWAVHFEWMIPVSDHINGSLADYDWWPRNEAAQGYEGPFTDLGYMRERWNDGQTINLDLEYHLCDKLFGLPVEVWPLAGFRWQRYSLTAYQLDQVLWDTVWDHRVTEGDVITFNQQYYMCCVGGQLRKTLTIMDVLPMQLTLQGDWGAAWGYNIDHHILRDLYSTMKTQGSSWHIGFTAESPLSEHLSLGLQVDYLNIRTTGSEHYFSETEQTDVTRSNGVCAYSDQTTLTMFLRLRR